MPTLKANFFSSPNVATVSGTSDSDSKPGRTFSKPDDVRGKDEESGNDKGPNINGGTSHHGSHRPRASASSHVSDSKSSDGPSTSTVKRPSGVFAPRSRLWTALPQHQSTSASHTHQGKAAQRGSTAERVTQQQRSTVPMSDGHRSSHSSSLQLPAHEKPADRSRLVAAPPSPSRNPADDSRQQQRRKLRWASGEKAGPGTSSVPSAATGLARAKQVAAALVSAEPPPQQSEAARAMQPQGHQRHPINSTKNNIPGSTLPGPPLHQQPPERQSVPANGGSGTHSRHKQRQQQPTIAPDTAAPRQASLLQDKDRMPQRVRSPNLGPACPISPTRPGNGKNQRGDNGGTASSQPSSIHQTLQPQNGNSNWGGVDSSADWEPPAWAVSGKIGLSGGAPPSDSRQSQVAQQPLLSAVQQSGPRPLSWEYPPPGACPLQPGGAAPATAPPPGSRFVRGNASSDLMHPPGFPQAGACPAHLQLVQRLARGFRSAKNTWIHSYQLCSVCSFPAMTLLLQPLLAQL